ncbi:MAG TPA: M61 family peptidase, partial [Chloroflexota bacterium]
MLLAAALVLLQVGCSKTEAPGTTTPATGLLTLAVDAREVDRKLFHAREMIPANPGPLTLVYPKWLPGEHAPTGPITDLVGLTFSAAGKPVTWQRDLVDMYAFHLDVPPGAQAVEATFDFLSAASTSGFSSAASVTPHLAVVTWNQLLLYPQGTKTDDVQIQASLKLPAGWKYGTALKASSTNAEELTFAPVSLTTLVDSPVLAGEFLLPISLDASSRPVEIDVAADSGASLEISPELTAKLKRLVAEADVMFGARHYTNYHFLLSLSDHVAHFGLEHHQSNDSRVYEKALLDQSPSLGVVAHEYVHSWNGKYRRPAGLSTPDFQTPMQGDLLWVYEGLTQYLGYVLAVRSGLWTEQYYRERLAQVAAYLDTLPGREWRPLVDTTIAAQLLYAAPNNWAALRRGTDFYDEGWLIWLDADTMIRQLSAGKMSLDDFCRKFHGGTSGSPMVKPYTLDDVVEALNEVAPYDWRTFLTSRVNRIGGHAPLDGLVRGGW